jgi:hypothetical protein
MGTRADFYIKASKELEAKDWIGSIAWDGYPSGIPKEIKESKTPNEFKQSVEKFAKERDDFTYPKDGWPWPWNDSGLTDYAYVFDCKSKKVRWNKDEWPDMSSIKNVVLFGKKSGLVVIQGK